MPDPRKLQLFKHVTFSAETLHLQSLHNKSARAFGDKLRIKKQA